MKTEESNVTRRSVLAGMGATATLTSSVALAVSARADEVPALYEAWKQANARAIELAHAVTAAEKRMAVEFGSDWPRVQYGVYRDARGDKQPLYASFEGEIDDATRAHVNVYPEAGEKRRKLLKEALQAEWARWEQMRKDRGIEQLSKGADSAGWDESAAWDRLMQTQATTPEGVALKIKAALCYAPNQMEDLEDLAGAAMASALADLESMDGAP